MRVCNYYNYFILFQLLLLLCGLHLCSARDAVGTKTRDELNIRKRKTTKPYSKTSDNTVNRKQTGKKSLPVAIDHFSPKIGNFKIIYNVDSTYWNPKYGPIFFYAGGETGYYYPGLMMSMAKDFKALVIYCQHRYYNDSMPFGKLSMKGPQYYKYLTSRQAIEDYVDVIFFEKTGIKRTANNISKFNTGRNPAFVVGASYSGELAAWMRKLYPKIFEGALASSAPIKMNARSDCNAFSKFVTNIFKNSVPGKDCADIIRKSWRVWNTILSLQKGRNWANKRLNLCTKLIDQNDAYTFTCWLNNILQQLAVGNTSYAGDFAPNPVQVFCKKVEYNKSNTKYLKSIMAALNVSYHYYRPGHCNHWNTNIPDTSYMRGPTIKNLTALRVPAWGWELQVCYEFPFPSCDNGVHDMFPKSNSSKFDEKVNADGCYRSYGIRSKVPDDEYGKITKNSASNIIFTNGDRDPWASGGILKSLSPTLIAIRIPLATHCADILPRNDDPLSLKKARIRIKEIFRDWTYKFYKRNGVKLIENVYPITIPGSTSNLQNNKKKIRKN